MRLLLAAIAFVAVNALITGCAVTDKFIAVFDPPSETKQPTTNEQQEIVYPNRQKDSESSDFAPHYQPDSRDYMMASGADDDSLNGMRARRPQLFSADTTHKSIREYAAQLAMQLMDRAVALTPADLVGVVSFVELDASLNTSSPLGNQLTEYFIGEIQHFGIGIVDFKVGNAISVTPTGDFIFSRNAERLADKLEMNHVLTGTMIQRSHGVSVNARIVALADRRVVASANVLIPDFVVAEINPYFTALH
ncbi:FlgO family outer membrane protein [Alteromonas flava]|uniref:FlgO family outer membrane protein n=1 Tax=Alteromonas flava TaxID=2048003 RepID=UPI000C285035|nr:FlgO family outer membrane protein [Alteromonas flava]